MGVVYSKEYLDELRQIKLVQYFKELMQNVNKEEADMIDYMKEKTNLSYDFKSSMAIFSNVQCYKSLSMYGIIKKYDRNTSYRVLEMSYLLSVWFNESTLFSKDDILKCDILILRTDGMSYNSEPKTNALYELLNTRKILQKVTWLFIEKVNEDLFTSKYPGVLELFARKYEVNI